MKNVYFLTVPTVFFLVVTVVSCTTGSDSVAPSDPAPEETQQHSVYYSPWPAGVDSAFQEGAFIRTEDIGFSHPPDWLLTRETGGRLLVRAEDLDGVITIRRYSRDSVEPVDRFLAWVTTSGGTVVWSDETVSTIGPMFLAIHDRGGEAVGVLWTGSENREVVLGITGSRESVENQMPRAIRLMKTVQVVNDGSSRHDETWQEETRQLAGGLRFGRGDTQWRWQEDLRTGFLLRNESLDATVAVWRNSDGTHGFDVIDGDVPAGELENMFVRNLAVRGTGEVD
jgi:hypothetical protein